MATTTPGASRSDLKAAGFADVSIEPSIGVSKAPSPREAAIAYCQGTPLRNEIEARDASRLEEATDRAAGGPGASASATARSRAASAPS